MAQYRYLTRFRFLEEYAEEVLNKYQGRFGVNLQPPIPIKAIARRLIGLRCKTCNIDHLGKEIDGVFLPADKLVLINEKHPITRRRYSIAHEIGHSVLMHGIDEARINNGNYSQESATSRERHAQIFAGALLMPRTFVHSEIKRYDVIDADAINKLATAFHVSPHAMLVRINYLLENFEPIKRPVDRDSVDHLESLLSSGGRSEGTIDFCVHDESRQDSVLRVLEPFEYDREDEDRYEEPEVIQIVREKLTELGIGMIKRGKEQGPFIPSPVGKLNRPLVIEFAGPPNSGKDTQVGILVNYFRDVRKYKVQVIQDEYRSCSLDTESDPFVDKFHRALVALVGDLLDVLDHPPKYDVVIVNKGLFDTLGFLHLYEDLRRIKKKDAKVLRDFLLLARWRSLEDIVLLLNISPVESIHREEKEVREIGARLARTFDPLTLPKPPKNIVSDNGLSKLNESYQQVHDKYGGLFTYVCSLPIKDNSSPEDTAVILLNQIHPKLPPKQPPPQKADMLHWANATPSNGNGRRAPEQLMIPELWT